MKEESKTYLVKVERNTTEVINEIGLFVSACDGISPENIRYSEWGLSICVTVGQRGCDIERIDSMRIGDVLRYKGRGGSIYEVRLMTIDTGDKKFAVFEVND